MCTPKQDACIHELISELGWNEFIFWCWQKAYYNVDGTSDLSADQAMLLIKDLRRILVDQNRNKAAAEDGKKMITQKQAMYLKTLWLDVDYSRGDNGDKHLSAFLEKRFHVRKVNDLTCKQAIACIYMIKRLVAQDQKRSGKTTVLEKKSKCRYCGNPIMWVQLTDGRRVPFDFDENNKATDFHECQVYKGHAAGR